MSGKYNITAEQGATFKLNFTVATDGTPWNLSTYTGRMQVRQSYASTTTLINVTSMTMTSQGKVSVVVDATTMAAVPAGRWVYDLEIQSTGGEVTRLLEGKFVVSPEVTH